MNRQRFEVERLAYSPGELAVALGCTRQHIQNLIARGELRSVKIGNRRLIPVAVVQELLTNFTLPEPGENLDDE